MLRITEILTDLRDITLHLEGRITEDWAKELYEICERYFRSQYHIKLDLSAVHYADRVSVNLLNRLIARGVKLIDCSLFLSALLNENYAQIEDE